jgi:6-pyruvoyltetrahydropterin/6-carboxytetrahydropterin synthase
VKLVYWTKAYRFCAGHRLFHPGRDEGWNLRVFGKCSYPGGHGHNYTLEVTVQGEPAAETGRVIAEEDLDQLIESEVMNKLDHRNLNEALSRDFGPAPTTEVVALEIWRLLEKRIPRPAVLYGIKVSETAKNTFEYFGP